jgi:hypothetical protein
VLCCVSCVMLCYVVLCYVMLCYEMQWDGGSMVYVSLEPSYESFTAMQGLGVNEGGEWLYLANVHNGLGNSSSEKAAASQEAASRPK